MLSFQEWNLIKKKKKNHKKQKKYLKKQTGKTIKWKR